MRDVQSTGKRNDVYGPGFVQLDMRLGYRLRLGGIRTLDVPKGRSELRGASRRLWWYRPALTYQITGYPELSMCRIRAFGLAAKS